MDPLELIIKQREILKKKYGVRKIGIFGSFARGSASKGSDVDVLVEFRKGRKKFDNYMDLKFFLEDVFKRDVDLVTEQALKPQLKSEILHQVKYVQGL
ncbi:MAG: nucleotidyltransferase family protein [Nitrospirota bacterium]